MKAIYFKEHGDVDVLRYGDLPEPAPKEGSAIVRVHYAALNHLDIWVRRGWPGLNLEFPHITGSDIYGEIVSIPENSDNFTPGDLVVVNPGMTLGEDEWTKRNEASVSPNYRILGEHFCGGLAEYVSVPIKCLLLAPKGMAGEILATIPVAGQTCWRMLKTLANVSADDSVLIVGSGGGVNSLALQLCKSFGCKTYVLAGSEKKLEKAKQLGATEVINYQSNPNWHREVLKTTAGRGVDFVIDNVGQATFSKSLKSLRFGGQLLTVGNTSGHELKIDNRLIFAKQLQIIGSTMGSHDDFKNCINYIQKNKINPVIDCIAPLAQGIEQIKRIEAGKQFGKIVLKT